MLEKPNLDDALLIQTLRDAYGLDVAQVQFLPLGNDLRSATYQVVSADGTRHFLKLRKGNFDVVAVAVPHFLNRSGIHAVMAPLETRTGQLWAHIDTPANAFDIALYPFIEGRNGFEVRMDDAHWLELGSALRAIHDAQLPADLLAKMPRETFGSYWRDRMRGYQARVLSSEHDKHEDPSAAAFVGFWREHIDEVQIILERAETLSTQVATSNLPFVLCHTDIHAGNVLISNDGPFYIVDWDMPLMAPKERDLMFVGVGMGDNTWNEPRQHALFYVGYGPTELNRAAIAYYRYERIVQDVVEFYHHIFELSPIAEEKALSVRYFTGSFSPGSVVEMAHQAFKEI